MAESTHTLQIIIRVVDKATKAIQGVEKKTRDFGKTIKGVGKAFNGFYRLLQQTLLGVGLSFLFTGMAINRFFQGILKSLTSTFLTVMGETTKQGQQVGRLQAAWEFLKFRIMSALVANGLWDAVIDKIQEIITNVTDWVEENQDAAANIAKWVGLIAAGGLFMMILGQVLLGVLGILGAVKFALSVISAALWLLLVPMSPWLIVLILIVGVLTVMRAKLGSWPNVFATIGNSLLKFLLMPFKGILTIVQAIIIAFAKLARLAGFEGAAREAEDAVLAIDKRMKETEANWGSTFYVDKSKINDSIGEGFMKMLTPASLEGLLGFSGQTATQGTENATNGNDGSFASAMRDFGDLMRAGLKVDVNVNLDDKTSSSTVS